jgi:hypothetical protein
VETFNGLLNHRNAPYVEAEAINGRGILETLKEIARLTVPVVRQRVLGESIATTADAESQEFQPAEMVALLDEIKAAKGPASPKKGEKRQPAMKTDAARAETPFSPTMIKVQSIEDIEKEIERLSKEFGLNSKK